MVQSVTLESIRRRRGSGRDHDRIVDGGGDRALSAMSVLKQSTSCPVHLDDGSSYADLPQIRASDTIDFGNARQCLGAKQAATLPWMHHPTETQQKVRFHLADFGEHALAGLAIGPRDHIGSLSITT